MASTPVEVLLFPCCLVILFALILTLFAMKFVCLFFCFVFFLFFLGFYIFEVLDFGFSL